MSLITRLTRPLSRHALEKPNFVYLLWRFLANGARTVGAMTTSTSFHDTRALARELTEQGIVVARSERLLTREGQLALNDATTRILHTSRSPSVDAIVRGQTASPSKRKQFLVELVSYPDGVPADDPLLRVALDERLLEIVASYLGFWPSLHSIGAWLNYPTDGPPEVSQLWHRDPGDLQLVKVFIYLVDVDDRCGPFTYIPATHPFGTKAGAARKLEKKKRVADDVMRRVLPPESWRVCTGPVHTMVLADTLGYHRGGKPLEGKRILVTFTYTSGTSFVERPIWLRNEPSWISRRIQRAAIKLLRRRA